ncbi:ATP-binding protein [Akkermansiaceae bacterium]|nr:ATP-binding protein [Akkermansiaceae bacterium]
MEDDKKIVIDLSALYIAMCYAYTCLDFDKKVVLNGYRTIASLYTEEAGEVFPEDILEPLPLEDIHSGIYYSLVDCLEVSFDWKELLAQDRKAYGYAKRLVDYARSAGEAQDKEDKKNQVAREGEELNLTDASKLVQDFMNGSWISTLIVQRPGTVRSSSSRVPETFGIYDKAKNTCTCLLEDDKAFSYTNRTNAINAWFALELGNYSQYLKGKAGGYGDDEEEVFSMLSTILEGVLSTGTNASERDWAEGKVCNVTLTGINLAGVALRVDPLVFSLAELRYMATQIRALNEIAEKSEGMCVTPSELYYGKSVRVDMTETHAAFVTAPVFDRYDLSLVNIDRPAEELVSQIKAILAKPEDERPQLITGFFYGVPGSGKSMLANYIGQQLGVPVLKKTYADLQSMYVGEGEKNLKDAFIEAEAKQAILLIDEIDSIAGNRQNADKNYQKTFTNQLLTELDNFNGIFLCTSNFMDDLDSAILRRLFLKIKFDFLTEEQQQTAFELYFPKLKRSKLGQMPYLTPGDFRAVREAAQFDVEKLNIKRVRELLQKEIDLKKLTLREVFKAEKTVGYHI